MNGKNFIEELKWRGLLHDMTPGADELIAQGPVRGYIGFDPTADSLGVGNLVQVMTLMHYQKCGNKPFALVGGATGMVGDPSGKSAERNLMDEEVLRYNQQCQQRQLEKFLDFNCGANSAVIVNNYDWFKEMGFLNFIRDIGKRITVNYMMAKDSVKNRISGEDREGMSFTEFTYQLIQGYDFYYLWKFHDVKMQMGGSDQWGNMTTGTELIRRIDGGEAYALTTPLIKKADGTKFGKTEAGNVWLDARRTSPYKFYQFWLNAADGDAENYIKIFSLLERDHIEQIIHNHRNDASKRLLQKELAKEVTTRVHGENDLAFAVMASDILFGKSTQEDLLKLNQEAFLEIFEGVPSGQIGVSDLNNGMTVSDLLVKSGFLPSNSEARRALQENSISINKEKIDAEFTISPKLLLCNQYILLQRGKKNYFIVKAVS